MIDKIKLFEVSYVKTFLMEEEEDRESGMIEKQNNAFDNGKKQFRTLEEVKEFINSFIEYQVTDENKDKYSYITYNYIDDKEGNTRIAGLCINNMVNSSFEREVEEYNEISEEDEIGTIDLYRTEIDTIWVSIREIEVLFVEGDKLNGLLEEMNIKESIKE
ncbi:MAG: hypothetical protein WC877_01890 [Dehalococcoidales bacterium]|jgi:hypothetical protein